MNNSEAIFFFMKVFSRMQAGRTLNMGNRTSRTKIAHLLVELFKRLFIIISAYSHKRDHFQSKEDFSFVIFPVELEELFNCWESFSLLKIKGSRFHPRPKFRFFLHFDRNATPI